MPNQHKDDNRADDRDDRIQPRGEQVLLHPRERADGQARRQAGRFRVKRLGVSRDAGFGHISLGVRIAHRLALLQLDAAVVDIQQA